MKGIRNHNTNQQGPSGMYAVTAEDAVRLETLAQRVSSLGRVIEDIGLGYVPDQETKNFGLMETLGAIVREAGAEIALIEQRMDSRRIDDEQEKIIRLQALLDEEEDGADEIDDTMEGVV